MASRKKELAFSLGGMGSATSNFYNDAYSRQGWADVAARVRERWQAGDRDGAAGLVTDEMVLATTLIGTEDMVRARLRTWREAGVDTVRLYPAGDTLAARLDNLGRGIDLVRAAGSLLSRTGVLPAPAGCEPIRRLDAGIAGSSLTCRYMLNPVRFSSRLTMGWQPVMISSRPCPARISWAQARTERPAQSAKPSADRSATRVFGARSRASLMACRRWSVLQTSSSPSSRSNDRWPWCSVTKEGEGVHLRRFRWAATWWRESRRRTRKAGSHATDRHLLGAIRGHTAELKKGSTSVRG